MNTLKSTLFDKIEAHRPRIKTLLDQYGDKVINEVTVQQVIGGMRGIKSLITDISYLDPYEGIRYRGYTLPEVIKKLPKPQGANMPSVEGLFYLLLTGDIPTENQVADVIYDSVNRRQLPKYVYEVIDAFPNNSHPMVILSAAVMSMQRESIFNLKYQRGMDKLDYWDPTFEDAFSLISKLPVIGAYIYNKLYTKHENVYQDPTLDFGGNFASMLGIDKPYDDVSRMYFIIHADHESGNVSAHAGHLISSSLSDIYYSISGMINGLAGPLHGLANQEVLRWIQEIRSRLGNKVPSESDMKKFVNDTLKGGQVIPGFGHAVLRKTDPRYTIQREFSLEHLAEDELFKYVDMLYKVVPPILQEHGKAKNPWPNVDAQSGVIQWHYGLTQYDFYTVLFSIGRSIGVISNIIWARALGFPIERPKSITTDMLEQMVGIK
ncbi:MAG: citrate (Si)-synthase [Lentimicrobiaceae bacterium]|jgi:citrate synthase|nr:citrate (Si)-synthase [Lentimicrobiaceae bacterium]MCP4910888.1 citrate (Si)-synthase [Bacteroidota bacterium]MBT3453742.1 citrate (Si)-synthase [Lentimicrobiaceae bacterium]MBT3819533.1 citrate (Si)-synthase [Lentimicrobiaceae bacterium]MBT4061674.1 citrate (Si)-synthase [Lentimicrobiaceae bacterium]